MKEYFQYAETIDHIFTLDDNTDLEFFKDKAIVFVRQAAWQHVLAEGTETLKEGNYEEAINVKSIKSSENYSNGKRPGQYQPVGDKRYFTYLPQKL